MVEQLKELQAEIAKEFGVTADEDGSGPGGSYQPLQLTTN